MSSSGTASFEGALRYVQDTTGKRAEMLFDVKNALGSVAYTAKFTPSEGTVSPVSSVTATQSVKVAKADSIVLHSAAKSSGSDVAAANLTISRTDVPASFSGMTASTATATSAIASIQGKVCGAINGNASFGGLIGGPYSFTKDRDSFGEKIEGSLAMQASSVNGNGTISGVSIFSVSAALNEMIQAAIDASWDGDTINVAKGTYYENLVLEKNLTVKGAGPGKTIVDGRGFISVVTIPNSASKVSLSGMTVQNGDAIFGGGIRNSGTLTLSDCTIFRNSALNGGAVYNTGMATLTKSTISGNTAVESGGAVYSDGKVSLINSKISENSADNGGAVYSLGIATIDKSTISGNIAGNDGGAVFSDGSLTITGSTLSKNAAIDEGGAVFSNDTTTIKGSTISRNIGCGIYSYGELTVDKSTISGNVGSGIDHEGTATITGCTISGNSGSIAGGVLSQGTVSIVKSIVSKNSGSYGGGIYVKGDASLTGSTISSNYASAMGGGVCNNGYPMLSGSATTVLRDCTVSGNTAGQSGGAVYNVDNLSINGTSQITGNTAARAYGGGIYSTGTLAFNGTKVLVKSNKAYLPQSPGTWYQGYGVYSTITPSKEGGFDPAKQVTGNAKA